MFEPALKVTPAPGRWVAEIGEGPDDFSIAKRGIDGQAILAFHRVRAVFDPEKVATNRRTGSMRPRTSRPGSPPTHA